MYNFSLNKSEGLDENLIAVMNLQSRSVFWVDEDLFASELRFFLFPLLPSINLFHRILEQVIIAEGEKSTVTSSPPPDKKLLKDSLPFQRENIRVFFLCWDGT